MKKRLLLWDIDGTLITTGGAGERALERIVATLRRREICGSRDRGPDRLRDCGQILAKYRIEPTAGKRGGFLDHYLGHLRNCCRSIDGRVLPGVPEILQRLHAIRTACWPCSPVIFVAAPN